MRWAAGVGSSGGVYPSRHQVSAFRFATANLFTRFVDVDHFATVLDEVDPDVLVAVELAPKASGVIESRYPHHHLAPDRGFVGWGVASRFPLEVDSGHGWGRGGAVRVELPETTLHLAAVHILDPLHLPFRETAAARDRQVDALLEWGDVLPPGEPQLVAGDFNASPIWKVYRRLAGRWDDVVAVKSPGTRPRRTWGLPPGLRLLRIDHVLGSGVVATHNRVLRVRGSDHGMVVVDLRLV